MSDTRIPLPLDRVSFPVKTPLFSDMDRTLIRSVLEFYKVASTPLTENTAGYKANRTKVLKSMVEDTESIDTPDTESVVKSMKSFLNPTKVAQTVNVDDEFNALFDGLTDSTDESSDESSDES